jgi:hypothetical protein
MRSLTNFFHHQKAKLNFFVEISGCVKKSLKNHCYGGTKNIWVGSVTRSGGNIFKIRFELKTLRRIGSGTKLFGKFGSVAKLIL